MMCLSRRLSGRLSYSLDVSAAQSSLIISRRLVSPTVVVVVVSLSIEDHVEELKFNSIGVEELKFNSIGYSGIPLSHNQFSSTGLIKRMNRTEVQDKSFPAIDRALEVLRSRHGIQHRLVNENSAGSNCDAMDISTDSIDAAKLHPVDRPERPVEALSVNPLIPVSAPYVQLKSALCPTIVRRLYVPTLREARQMRSQLVARLVIILASWKERLDLRTGFLSFCAPREDSSEIQWTASLDMSRFSFVAWLRFILEDDSKTTRNRPRGQALRLALQRHGKYKIATWFHNYMIKYRVFWRLMVLYSRSKYPQSRELGS